MSSSLPNGISSLKLKVSTYEQVIASASLGSNSIKVTEQNILNALQSGVTINPSMAVTYNNAAFSSGTGNVDVAGTPYVPPPPPPPTWDQRGADIDGEANNNYSGYSVSLSTDGSIVAIGANGNAGGVGGYQRGHVRVYVWNVATSTWDQLGNDIDGEANSDYSGQSVSLSTDGSIVAIGAIYNAGGGYRRGHVRVYTWNGSTWGQLGADIDGEADNDQSGTSVSLSSDGTIVAIGAYINAGGGTTRGHVRVYAWNEATTTWVQRGADIDGEADSDRSGTRVSLSSDGLIVAIGAPYNAGGGYRRGHVRVYTWNGSTWGQLGADIDGEADENYSGQSVSLSSNGLIVAIGAYINAGGVGGYQRGHVRVYTWNGSTWGQLGNDIDGEANSDRSGTRVSLSSDGLIVAIGAPYNAGGGSINSYRGHVRVYELIGSTWVQRGADIDGEADSNFSGNSVSLSSDGSIVAIGAHYNAGGDTQRGHVRVHKYQ